MVSKTPARSPSPTDPGDPRGAWTTCTAGVALRLGRTPDEGCWKWASKSGASTLVPACGPTRSRTVGIPSGLCRPSGWGREPRSTGCGLELPAPRAGASAWRQAATPCGSTSALRTPSTPALPPCARTSRQARPRIAGRQRRSSSAGKRRCLRRLAARSSGRWRGRDGASGCGWPVRAGLVTAPLAAQGCSRGPALPPRCAVSGRHRPVTASDVSDRLPLDFGAALSHGAPGMWATDGLRPPGFPRGLSQQAAPPTPERSSGRRFRSLHPVHGLRLACTARHSRVPGR